MNIYFNGKQLRKRNGQFKNDNRFMKYTLGTMVLIVLGIYVSMIAIEEYNLYPITYTHIEEQTRIEKLQAHRDLMLAEEKTQAESLRYTLASCEQEINEKQQAHRDAVENTNLADEYIAMYTKGI